MIQSMTGFGKADAILEGKTIHIEVRSLNSKSMDLSTRVASRYREKEMEIRTRVSQVLERGKVDFYLWLEKDETTYTPVLNAAAAESYLQQMKEISAKTGIPMPTNPWEVLVRLPESTMQRTEESLEEEEWSKVCAAIDEALNHLIDFRKQEGEALAKKFTEKLDAIAALKEEIVPFEKARVEKIRKRLEERLEELTGVDYDKNRLEQELIYYIEKLDISEEKQRLTNHIAYFRETMLNGSGQGKKLGFIAQEMGREINTTGSKSNIAEMQNIVVRMKDELEQIKEQVLNVM
ncbi:YicC/YloC family endoribonuclease [Prevotellamassilia timonensis]|uniref:YicC/YloC family endoribonuclease n=1 Tax=Prevotellamassilia timonensis TaxID=1852370 RepID=UPI001F187DCA|nr:YicC/YloC family endoribonuclease [Prevotellamassilia timonensis]MCF2634444.1 YicC family protein [Prevotellamassilia timonensis]